MNLNIEIVKQELEYIFGDKLGQFLGKPIKECTDDHILNVFNDYANNNLKTIKIKDLIDNYQDKAFLIDTPDDLQDVGDFYIKGPKEVYEVKTINGYSTKCSFDHKFETLNEWKFAKDLSLTDLLLTKDGYAEIEEINIGDELEFVYDFEVLHENHRYWSGEGLSSHNTAKSYISLSICRSAQEMGYMPIYVDTEGSIDEEFVTRIGVDPAKFRIEQFNTIEKLNHYAASLVQSLEEMKSKGEETPKIIFVLDSLGNLSSDKEFNDSREGSDKRDMTKQQNIRKFFRVNGLKFAKLGIPLIVVGHVYQSIGSYIQTNEISGGGGLKYNVSVIFMLTKSKLDDKESEQKAKDKNVDAVRTGVTITVTPVKQRFAKPIKTQIHIPFYKKPNPFVGLEPFVSWDACGIMRGKAISEKEYNKLKPEEQKLCKEFTDVNGTLLYAMPKDTARSLVCRHLKGEVPLSELFTEKVFTSEVLKELDEKVIKPTFSLPNINSLDDLAELTEELEKYDVDSESDTSDDEKLF